MIQDAMHRIGQSLVGIQHHQRTGNDGERVTKFVRDIGKEFHIHLLGTLLALCFTLFLQKTKMIGTGLQIEPVESIEHENDDTKIEQPCRWRPPRSRLDDNLYLTLCQCRTVHGRNQSQMEGVFTWCQIGIMSHTFVSRCLPILIIAL